MSTTPSLPGDGSESSLSSGDKVINTYHEALRAFGSCTFRVVDDAKQYYHLPSEETRGLLDASARDASQQLEQCLPLVYKTELARTNEYVAVLLQLIKSEENLRLSATESVMPGIPFDDITYDNREILNAIYDDLADMLEEGDVSSWKNCKQLYEQSLECYIDRVTSYADIGNAAGEIIDATMSTVRREQYKRLAIRIGEMAYIMTTGTQFAKLLMQKWKNEP